MGKLSVGLCLSMFTISILQGESLTDVIQKSVYNNPQVRASIENYRASLHELDSARAGYKPTLDISAEVGKEHTETPGNLHQSKDLREQQTMIVGKYNLFEGFKTSYEVEEKQNAVELAKNKVFEKVNAISMLITQIYIDLLRKKELLEIAKRNVELHLETIDKVKKRLKLGAGYESELHQTQSRVDLAKTSQIIAEKNYEISKINYRRFIGSPPKVSSFSKPLSSSLHNMNIEVLLQDAKTDNFNIKIKESEVQVAKLVHKQQRSKYYPTLDLEVSQTWNDNVHGVEGKDDSYKAALVLNYNLYNGGSDRASELSALRKFDMNERGLDDIKLTVEEQVRIGLMKYSILEQQLLSINQQLVDLNKTKTLYEKEYENNKRTIVDLLNIKQEYNDAKSQQVNADYDKLQTYFQIKAALGDLISEFNLLDILDRQEVKDVIENKDTEENTKALTDALDNTLVDNDESKQ